MLLSASDDKTVKVGEQSTHTRTHAHTHAYCTSFSSDKQMLLSASDDKTVKVGTEITHAYAHTRIQTHTHTHTHTSNDMTVKVGGQSSHTHTLTRLHIHTHIYIHTGVGVAHAALCLHADGASELGALLPTLSRLQASSFRRRRQDCEGNTSACMCVCV